MYYSFSLPLFFQWRCGFSRDMYSVRLMERKETILGGVITSKFFPLQYLIKNRKVITPEPSCLASASLLIYCIAIRITKLNHEYENFHL